VVAESNAVGAMFEATRLDLIRDLDHRPEAVPGARVGTTAATFLVHGCRVSPGQAHRDVAAAHALDPDVQTGPDNPCATSPTRPPTKRNASANNSACDSIYTSTRTTEDHQATPPDRAVIPCPEPLDERGGDRSF
jgi:hypothetical protein